MSVAGGDAAVGHNAQYALRARTRFLIPTSQEEEADREEDVDADGNGDSCASSHGEEYAMGTVLSAIFVPSHEKQLGTEIAKSTIHRTRRCLPAGYATFPFLPALSLIPFPVLALITPTLITRGPRLTRDVELYDSSHEEDARDAQETRHACPPA
ncbi:hypothetical protein C8R46DRAFT_1207255 [Mycena filopes]|nr:hypothetical protein C8R46DRAFT_1207255 [Mycena filopes]